MQPSPKRITTHNTSINKYSRLDRSSNRTPTRPPVQSTSFNRRDHHHHQNYHYHQHQELRTKYVNLITNAYSIHTKPSKSSVYEYSLKITQSEGYRNVPSQILFRNFVSSSIRRTIIQKVVPQLLGSGLAKGSVVIEQNLDAIFSTRPFRKQTIEIDENHNSFLCPIDLGHTNFEIKNISIKSDLLCHLKIDLEFNYARTFCLDSTTAMLALINSILHHQLWLTRLKFGAVYFLSHKKSSEFETRYSSQDRGKLDIISEHAMGISLSGLKQTTKNETLVVVHCSHSYITRSHRLIDLLASLIRAYPVDKVQLDHQADAKDIERFANKEILNINGTEKWFVDLCSALYGFKCQTINVNETDRINLRFNVTSESASNLIVGDTGKTVQEQYQNLGINLNYPNLPCLKTKSSDHPYYPLEMCILLADQKVPIFRLNPSLRNHLNLLNKPKPQTSYWSSYNAKKNVESIARDEMETFGVSLSQESVEAQGVVLSKPTLQFNDLLINPNRDFWESGKFYQPINLINNWCVVNTVDVDVYLEDGFFRNFSQYCSRFGLNLSRPHFIFRSKNDLLNNDNTMANLIEECQHLTRENLRLILFVIDSNSGNLNRLVHLSFDDHANVSAACLRLENIINTRVHRALFRTLGHKLNARLGGTNLVFHRQSLERLNLNPSELMIIGLDVTHPDNELKGSSIVGCAYTYSPDLFKHKSLVWPQAARVELINKMDILLEHILSDYYRENNRRFPGHIIIYRDGVSHEEFERVKDIEVGKSLFILSRMSKEKNRLEPKLSYVIAQKRHSMRFFQRLSNESCVNPPSGTLIDRDVVSVGGREFYLYSNTGPQSTARPIHYHVLLGGLSQNKLQELTYFLCFNFGKCSGSLSMPSSLKYAHNAAYDARNRVIASREFREDKFYNSKFFC